MAGTDGTPRKYFNKYTKTQKVYATNTNSYNDCDTCRMLREYVGRIKTQKNLLKTTLFTMFCCARFKRM